MSIGSIGSADNWPSAQSSPAESNWQNVLAAASSTLGLSTSALQQQLRSGSSLSSIAQSQGVSQQTLVSSISAALTQNGSTATGSQLQQLATDIANRTPGGHHRDHGETSSTGTTSNSPTTDDSSATASASSTPSSASSETTSASSTSSTDESLLSALTAASSSSTSALLSALTDDSSAGSDSTLANLAGESDLWQGIDMTA